MFNWIRRLASVGCAALAITAQAGTPAIPRYDHVVVVILENHRLAQIIGNKQAPYLTSLANEGVSFTNSHGVTHPSQPNYLALFSGSTQGVKGDACPVMFAADNLAAQMAVAKISFIGYAEDLPAAGYTGCRAGKYARKHVPWTDFSNIDAAVNQPFSAFPSDYTALPALAFVTPNMCNDMHDCEPDVGDAWMKREIDGYAQWAKTHNSLLIVTFDEDDYATQTNLIPTVFYVSVQPSHLS
jgi:acid phosphatase